MLRLGILVSGGGTNFQAIIDAVESGKLENVQIVTVVSNRENAFAVERAKRHSLPCTIIQKKEYASKEEFDEAILNHMKANKVELIVMAGFLAIVGEKLIKEYENKIINVHPSLIPSFCGDGYYGIKIHEKVLEYGVKVTGATVHFVNEITDGGPIILQKAVYIDDDITTPEELQKKVMAEAEWVILPKAINLIAKGKVFIEGRKVKIEK